MPDASTHDDTATRGADRPTARLSFPGLKQLLLPRRPHGASMDIAAQARALFHPPDLAMARRRPSSLVEFLPQVSLFEDLDRRDLVRLARIVHEREYADGESICEEGTPATALFVVRRGVVDVVKRTGAEQEVPLALLEPPASFDESAAIGTGAIHWFSVRARGPASLLGLGKSDLDSLMLDAPVLANKILVRLAGIMALRLHVLIETETLRELYPPQEGT